MLASESSSGLDCCCRRCCYRSLDRLDLGFRHGARRLGSSRGQYSETCLALFRFVSSRPVLSPFPLPFAASLAGQMVRPRRQQSGATSAATCLAPAPDLAVGCGIYFRLDCVLLSNSAPPSAQRSSNARTVRPFGARLAPIAQWSAAGAPLRGLHCAAAGQRTGAPKDCAQLGPALRWTKRARAGPRTKLGAGRPPSAGRLLPPRKWIQPL